MINIQPIEKREYDAEGFLQVHSMFRTIQGEGPFAGRRAFFIRLAGCNLQCPACDTQYTEPRTRRSVSSLVQEVRTWTNPGTLVVITGGEPFRQNVGPLVRQLLNDAYTVQIETNGTLAPSDPLFADMCSTDLSRWNRCFVVCSPKTGQVNKEIRRITCAFKYVMKHDSIGPDGLPLLALDHTASPYVARPGSEFRGPVYLQPCDDKDKTVNHLNLDACVKSVIANGYILQLQIHKFANLE